MPNGKYSICLLCGHKTTFLLTQSDAETVNYLTRELGCDQSKKLFWTLQSDNLKMQAVVPCLSLS